VFIVAPINLSPGRFAHRQRLTRQHRFVERTAALDHDAINRHLLARSHAQQIADMHMREGNVGFAAVRRDPARRLGRQAQQRLDRRRGLGACFQFKDLPEQRQRNDHRRRLEVHRYPPHQHERSRKHLWCDRGCHAVEKGGAGAQPDQGPHVRTAAHDRLRAAHEEGPACPQHDRQGEPEFDPALTRHVEPAQAVTEHRQQCDRHRQGQGPPEAALEIHQLRVVAVLQFGQHRLQRHAALGATTGLGLADLGVHRAGVDRAGRAKVRAHAFTA